MRPAPTASRRRLILLGAVACLWLARVEVRLVELQLTRHDEFARRALHQQQRTLDVTPKRGVLTDRHGRELAVSISVESAFAVPSEMTDPELAARLLAPALGLEPEELAGRLASGRSFLWLKRKLEPAEAERIRALNLRGVYFQPENKRFYPKRELAAHVLGFVGLDENGLAGVEYAFDDIIRGKPRRLTVSADGRRRRFGSEAAVPAEGAGLELTLDENLQYIAERELAAAVARTRASAGTIIIQDPRTGELLALANYPTFNPNDPAALPEEWRVNRALTLAYEPGSTFKVVTIAAALEEGLARPEELIDCQQGRIVLAGHTIRDHKPFGLLSVREVVEESSDVGAIKLGLRLGERRMHEHIRRWGFGRATEAGLPAESRGLLRPAAEWSRISIGAVSMGQEVAITPLQLAAATSVIANGGEWVQPRIVRKIFRSGGEEALSAGRRERILAKGTVEELARMLQGVVLQGTGLAAQPEGYSAAGKTGTAQKIDSTGRYSPTDYIASFAGYAPASGPALTIVVVLDTPRGQLYHGGEVAAPVFKAVAEQALTYLNVPRDLALPPTPARSAPRFERAALRDFQPGQFVPAADFVPAAWGGAWGSEGESRIEVPAVPPGTIITGNGESALVPDFAGQPLRAVAEDCGRLGLELSVAGSGIALRQVPAAGTLLPRGSRVRVEFRPLLPAAPARPM